MTCEVFIIGADGLIGSSLARCAAKNKIAWVGTSRNPKTEHGNILHLDLPIYAPRKPIFAHARMILQELASST
jgi:nucleoside-diphosphate-sugar epimerase